MANGGSQGVVEQWRSGVALSHAWLEFGDPYAVGKYRQAKSLQAMNAQQILMVYDLWDGLNSGELRAFGKCVAPVISDGPVLIPTHVFEFYPSHEVGNSDHLEISGWRYESVKVARCDVTSGDLDPTTSSDFNGEVRKNSGRPDTYRFSSDVLSFLYLTDSNRSLSAAKLRTKFVAEFERRFPREKYQMSPPSLRTLQDQIKRFRQESAEIGNN